MSDRDHIVSELRRELADQTAERPEPVEIRDWLGGVPQESARRRTYAVLAFAALVVIAVTFAVFRPDQIESAAAGFEDLSLPLLSVQPGEGFSKEEFRATMVVREKNATLRLDYEPADGGPRERIRTSWKPLPAPAGAGEDELPALRIVADGSAPWHLVQRLAAPNMGARTSFYLAGRTEDGTVHAFPLLVNPPPVARKLGATVTPQDLGSSEHPGAFRAIRLERNRRRGILSFGPLGGLGINPEGWRLDYMAAFNSAMVESANPSPSGFKYLRTQVAQMERIRTPEGDRRVILVLASHATRVVDVLRVAEVAGGDAAVMFWTSNYDRGVMSDGRGLARDLLRPWLARENEVVVRVPVAGALHVDLPGRKGLVCEPGKIPFPEERFERLVLETFAATPWSACRPAVVQARRRGATVAFKFAFGKVLTVPPTRGGQSPVRVRIGVSGEGKVLFTPGEEELVGKDIVISAFDEATAEDVLQTLQFLLWRGVAGVDFE